MKMLVKDYDKTALRNFVKDTISGKIKTLEFYLNFTLEATREVKKTSKYDSIREEMQEEIYHLDKQMFTLKTMQKKMNQVLHHSSDRVKLGSLVITNKARFYLSVSLGEFFYEGDRFYAISEESPMAKIMLGKTEAKNLFSIEFTKKLKKLFN